MLPGTVSYQNWAKLGAAAVVPPVIETADVTTDGNGSIANPSVNHPATAVGDLVIFCFSAPGEVTFAHGTGPNGETLVVVVDSFTEVAGTGATSASLFYYIATDARAASTFIPVTISTATTSTVGAIKVPAGEFNPTTPIDSSSTLGNNSNTTAHISPSWAVGAAGGRPVVFYVIVTDPHGVNTPTGWTQVMNLDPGNPCVDIYVRNAGTTAAETIAAFTVTAPNRPYGAIGFSVNGV
jgi:hypothetical protein